MLLKLERTFLAGALDKALAAPQQERVLASLDFVQVSDCPQKNACCVIGICQHSTDIGCGHRRMPAGKVDLPLLQDVPYVLRALYHVPSNKRCCGIKELLLLYRSCGLTETKGWLQA